MAVMIGGFVVGSSRHAAAQGYGFYQHDACTMAMGGAGVAEPCPHGSAIFFNPAALADLDGTVFTLGGTLIGPHGDFTPDGGQPTKLEDKWINVPNLYYARDLGARAKFGLGLMAPYGLEIAWPLSFEGRFLSYESKLQAVYVQPTLAFEVNDQLLVGGGVDVSYAKVELKQSVDLSTQPIPGTAFTFGNLGVPRYTDFADITLKGDAVQLGFHLGALVKATDRVSFGVRYLSRQKIETEEGDFETRQIMTGLRTPVPLPGIPAGASLDALLEPLFAAGGRLADQSVGTSLYLPDQFVAGVAFQASDGVKVKVDYQHTNWSLFDVLVIETENGLTDTNVESYRDSHGLRVGTQFDVNDRTALRGGFIAHTAAAPDETVTPLLPEGARWELTVGVGREVSQLFGIDLAYQYLRQQDRRGRITDGEGERPTTALNSGEYTFRGHLVGMNLNFSW
jgi:long-chain fatty acid transport protein